MTGKELLEMLAVDAAAYPQLAQAEITALSSDSRKLTKGSLFVALAGEQTDGHKYLAQVQAQGAVAAVVEREDANLDLTQIVVPDTRAVQGLIAAAVYGTGADQTFIAVTGTDGKTTTTQLIRHLLNLMERPCGAIGTIGIQYAHEVTGHADYTTPMAPELHATIQKMRKAGCSHVVMEVSSHALDQGRTDGIDFQVAVFTNLTQDHIDYHHSIEGYAQAKGRLFSALKSEAAAVLDAHDPTAFYFASVSKAKRIFYRIKNHEHHFEHQLETALTPWWHKLAAEIPLQERQAMLKEAELWEADELKAENKGTRFVLHALGQKKEIFLPLWGEYNVENALAALAAVCSLGCDLDEAIAALATFPGVPGRIQLIDAGQDFSVLVDYAHTPGGTAALLSSLKRLPHNKLWVLCNCCGSRDQLKRPMMGAVCAEYADELILTSEETFMEAPEEITAEVAGGFPPGTPYRRIMARTAALRYTIEHMQSGDIAVTMGLGDQTTINIDGQNIPYNDAEFIHALLSERRLREALLKQSKLTLAELEDSQRLTKQ